MAIAGNKRYASFPPLNSGIAWLDLTPAPLSAPLVRSSFLKPSENGLGPRVLLKGVPQGYTESGGIVLAAMCWATSAQRRCHPKEVLYLPTFSHLSGCQYTSFSLSLSLSLSLSDKGDFMSRSRSLYCHSNTGPMGSTALILRERIRSYL